MAYDIVYDSKVIKQLTKLDRSVALMILNEIESFASNPVMTKIKKLKTPFDGAYRLRINDYRVIFYHEENMMLVSKIAHRKDVYL